jgi:hypothetical protein
MLALAPAANAPAWPFAPPAVSDPPPAREAFAAPAPRPPVPAPALESGLVLSPAVPIAPLVVLVPPAALVPEPAAPGAVPEPLLSHDTASTTLLNVASRVQGEPRRCSSISGTLPGNRRAQFTFT